MRCQVSRQVVRLCDELPSTRESGIVGNRGELCDGLSGHVQPFLNRKLVREELCPCQPDLCAPFDLLFAGGRSVGADLAEDLASQSELSGLDKRIAIREAQLVATRVTTRQHTQRALEKIGGGCNVQT